MAEVRRILSSDQGSVRQDRVGRPLKALPSQAELGVSVRAATLGDVDWIDGLMKSQSKAVGFAKWAQLRGNIERGDVLVAEAGGSGQVAEWSSGRDGSTLGRGASGGSDSATGPLDHSATSDTAKPVGYVIGRDQYFKRDDVGIVYQMNVVPEYQRGLVAATLLQGLFDRSAYGCRLFCCWCAQDLKANEFWEAMGFVALAFRTGSRKRDRVHIFWQKPVRAEDAAAARRGAFGGWWFPSRTGSGALREERLVLPIPPGVHWSEAKPRVLPGMEALFAERAAEVKRIEDAAKPSAGERRAARAEREAAKALERAEAARRAAEAAQRRGTVAMGGLRFGAEPSSEEMNREGAKDAKGEEGKKKRGKRPALRHDAALVAAARELRDRYLERVAAEPGVLTARGGYLVGKGEGSVVKGEVRVEVAERPVKRIAA